MLSFWCLSCIQNCVYAYWVWNNDTTFPWAFWALKSFVFVIMCLFKLCERTWCYSFYVVCIFVLETVLYFPLFREISLGKISKPESLPFLNITLCQHFPSLCQIFDTAFLRY